MPVFAAAKMGSGSNVRCNDLLGVILARRVAFTLAHSLHAVYCLAMNTYPPIHSAVSNLISADPAGRTGLAAKLHVTESTVARWESGQTTPRPKVAQKIREMAQVSSAHQIQEPASQYVSKVQHRDEELRHKVQATLAALREAMHKGSSFSSRHEALDEVTKLMYAHIMSILNGEGGISQNVARNNKTTAQALKSFVDNTIEKQLPASLAHELDHSDFRLRIKNSENLFASEIIAALEALDSLTVQEATRSDGEIDLLNDVFGQFLADSFVEEKELGQYLTPHEVVRFMVRLGIGSLPQQMINALSSPTDCDAHGIILDPSCGVGSFLTEVLRTLRPRVEKTYGPEASREWLDKMLSRVLVGVDKSERMIKLSLANLSMFGANAAQLHFGNALAREDDRLAATMSQFEGTAQLIFTNPPFGAQFAGQELAGHKIATEWCTKSPPSVDSELLFLERYIDWLKPGGSLVTVIPDSVLTNKGLFSDLREGIAPMVELQSVISLPSVTFGAAGTTTKTSVLHLKKRANGPSKRPVFFAVCKDLGYSVATRSSQRRKFASGTNELEGLLPEAIGSTEARHGRRVSVDPSASRWDATFHAGLSNDVAKRLVALDSRQDVLVRDVAHLATDRVNPARSSSLEHFDYIEISGVDSTTLEVTASTIKCANAPSRARKLVRVGDVLVSTVRPERRTMGIVPEELDGAVCSTGFAVLRCDSIDPTILCFLMQSEFVNQQILRNNVGIAYPAINEECLLKIMLPVRQEQLDSFASDGKSVRAFRQEVRDLENKLRQRVLAGIDKWTA